jgi:hypothetical protein
MKILNILFCIIFLTPMAALAQNSGDTILITTEAKSGSGGKEVEEIANSLAIAIGNQLKLTYPCVQTITDSDIKKMLEFEKNKELLTGESGDTESIARAFNTKYNIHVKVSQFDTGEVALNAFVANQSKAEVPASFNTSAANIAAARKAIKDTAKQFVNRLYDLPFANSVCIPANLWTGTVNYSRSKHDEKTDTSKTFDGEGTNTSTTKNVLNYNVMVQIGLKGKPQGYSMLFESLIGNQKEEKRINCRRSFGNHPDNWKSIGWTKMSANTKQAISKEGASVSVAVSKGRYTISVTLPAVVGTEVSSETTHHDGGCGSPSDKTLGPFTRQWIGNIYAPYVDMPLQKPDELQGSIKDNLGGTLTWNLTRTPVQK